MPAQSSSPSDRPLLRRVRREPPPDRRILPDVLPQVLRRAAELQSAGAVLFDLDSTLLDNRPRQARILREFGAAGAVAPLLSCAPEHFDGWSLKVPMRSLGLSETEVENLEPQAKQYWRDRFFTSEYCVDDVALAGAVDFVQKVQETGARIIYCTGRHPAMRQGTIDCFAREGFPIPDEDRVSLLMKPQFDMHDDDWKLLARDQIAQRGQLIAAFDNEPTHINTYREQFPDAICVHLLTDESARGISVHLSIPSIYDFEFNT
ncbi:MAG TPA: hypothetical protein PKI03_29865 [Pseudomonadota bacterium]|nr:hypothetical protein [Pseudomonadota bacterium]